MRLLPLLRWCRLLGGTVVKCSWRPALSLLNISSQEADNRRIRGENTTRPISSSLAPPSSLATWAKAGRQFEFALNRSVSRCMLCAAWLSGASVKDSKHSSTESSRICLKGYWCYYFESCHIYCWKIISWPLTHGISWKQQVTCSYLCIVFVSNYNSYEFFNSKFGHSSIQKIQT